MISAVLVPDIRRSQYNPGAIEYDATERAFYIACPCGCGQIERVAWPRSSFSGELAVSLSLNQPLIFIRDSRVHWAGRLIKGKYIVEE